jgi:hypothetical protein
VALQAGTAAGLQSAVGVQPELPLAMLAYLAFHGRRETVVPAAVAVGALVSLFTIEPAGVVLVLHLAVALGVLSVRGILFREDPVTEALSVFGATFVYRVACVLVVTPRDIALPAAWVIEAVASAAATTGVAVILFPLFRRLGLFRRLLLARGG